MKASFIENLRVHSWIHSNKQPVIITTLLLPQHYKTCFIFCGKGLISLNVNWISIKNVVLHQCVLSIILCLSLICKQCCDLKITHMGTRRLYFSLKIKQMFNFRKNISTMLLWVNIFAYSCFYFHITFHFNTFRRLLMLWTILNFLYQYRASPDNSFNESPGIQHYTWGYFSWYRR